LEDRLAFDPTKDKTIKSKVFDAATDGQQIEVKLVSYDSGPEKIQISRFNVVEGSDNKFLKLGRLTLDEARCVRDAITALAEEE